MKLSVIIITKNEAANLGACLASVAFADEIIVLDSGSTDNTLDIARFHGAKVHSTTDWPGFGPQKNRALALATGDWVLSIDADERVTPELAGEIREILQAPVSDAYRIARLSRFGERWIRHSGWWPDYVVRLFKRGCAHFTSAKVHERLDIQGPVPALKAHFLHYPYANLEAFIAKINLYSSEAAAAMHARGKRTSVLAAVGHATWTFLRHYVVRRGFLDGREGFILAVMAATGSYYRYTKLLFLNRDAARRDNVPDGNTLHENPPATLLPSDLPVEALQSGLPDSLLKGGQCVTTEQAGQNGAAGQGALPGSAHTSNKRPEGAQ